MDEPKGLSPASLHNERSHGGAFVFLLVLVGALIALDQYAKHAAFTSSWGSWLNIFSPVLFKSPLRNRYFAFGLQLPSWLMYAIYAAVLAAATMYWMRNFAKFSYLAQLAFGLIFAGAISNLAERLLTGGVRDFIYLLSGVFNLADVYIVIGIAILFFAGARLGNL